MDSTPHTDLIDRINALYEANKVLTPLHIMTEAKVTYANWHNWQKMQIKSLERWLNLMNELGYDPLEAKPKSSTYKLAKQTLLTRDAVKELFVKVGYSDQTPALWEEKGDPRQIENFKKVNQVVTNYEKQFLNIVS